MRVGERGAFRENEVQFHPVGVADTPVTQGAIGKATLRGFAIEHFHQLPLASRMSNFLLRPSQTMYPPKVPLMSVAAAVSSAP
jgi:hypothetical protein